MPILWRFLLTQYIKVLILCATTFIAVLLTTRLDEIAHFAALGAEGRNILLYALYQIPYIIPIAIPISCLISSILLVQKLSTTCELTALRSSGMAIGQFLSPILFAAAFIALINFYIVSEVATDSHLSSGMLKTQLRSVNPLLMLHSKHLMKVKGFYFDTLGPSKMGETASEVILGMPNHSSERIHLMVATQLNASADNFMGKGISLITSMEGSQEGGFDHLMIENIGKTITSIEDFAGILQKKSWSISNDHLNMSLLLAKIDQEKKSVGDPKVAKKTITRCYSEIARRVSLGFAAFTFTLMGASFGMSISRNKSNRGIFIVIVLAAIFLCTFFLAKGLDGNLIASILLYTIPHFIIIGISLWVLSRISRGIET